MTIGLVILAVLATIAVSEIRRTSGKPIGNED
jgi:hypothetical protein